MSNDYLWDGSGEADPEIQKLESTLGRLRHNRPAPEFPAISLVQARPRRRGFFSVLGLRLLIPAGACAVLVLVVFLVFRSRPTKVVPSDWNVSIVEGAPRVGGADMNAGVKSRNLGIGQLLETDSLSRATIRAEETGEIDIEPGTRLRLLKSTGGFSQIALERGTIHATIWAEPGEFVVDTPSAVAVDLGCAYTLKVDASGDGLLRTTLGWVGFRLGDRESFIPAGAVCATKKQTGPGTPYFEDASEAFRKALAAFDQTRSSDAERAAALNVVLAESRSRDALTLWHLLVRAPAADRSRVYDKMAQLLPPPSGVTREGILRLDQRMLDLWWNELGLGDVAVWRHWERSWSPDGSGGK